MKYNKDFVNGMKTAGSIAAKILKNVASYAKEGITTNELDQIAFDLIKTAGVEPACLGYKGYPKTLCTSVNEVLCHGVPDNSPLSGGDLINIDVTIKLPKTNYHGDTSLTLYIPHLDETKIDEKMAETKELIKASKEAMEFGIRTVRPNGRTGDIGYVTSMSLVKYNGKYNSVAEIGGHGIGKKFHQNPFVPGVGNWGEGDLLIPFTCITVEPIVVKGLPEFTTETIENSEIYIHKTLNGENACQFEHTILITDTGYEILTEA